MKKAEFSCMIDPKILIHETSVHPKLLQLKIFVQSKKKAAVDFSPIFSKITERFGLLIAGDRIVVPDELKRQVVDALHFGQPLSTKMLAEGNKFWWSGMKKYMENECSACIGCMSSGLNLEYQLPSTEKIKLPFLTES